MSGFSDFLFGGNKWGGRQDDIYNRLSAIDNRKSDFNRYAGNALNSLSGRGVINSSVASSALADAAAKAEDNYLNNQRFLAQLAFGRNDSGGLIPGLLGSLGNGLSTGLGLKLFGLL